MVAYCSDGSSGVPSSLLRVLFGRCDVAVLKHYLDWKLRQGTFEMRGSEELILDFDEILLPPPSS